MLCYAYAGKQGEKQDGQFGCQSLLSRPGIVASGMLIIGVDFTSAPRRQKPITSVTGRYIDDRLVVENFSRMVSFDQFETLLEREGPWIAGMDFPFGQSRKFVQNMNWPMSWERYVSLVAGMSRDQFANALEAYKAPRMEGDKEHRRETDRLAGAISPQKLYGVPVGKMFYEGARRLLSTSASILPVRVTGDNRLVVEAYPALVARRFTQGEGYKSDTRARQTEAQRRAREKIVAGLRSDAFMAEYGYEVQYSEPDRSMMIDDPTGDELDALLCAIQAAWAWKERNSGFGIPEDVDVLEGWIIDPALRSGCQRVPQGWRKGLYRGEHHTLS